MNLPAAVHRQHHFRFRVVPLRTRVNANPAAAADRGQHRCLGEDLRVRTDTHFQILRPHVLFDKKGFQAHGLLGAWNDRAQVVADHPVHGGPHGFSLGGITTGLLLDHTLDHAGGEGHAGRLDHLQIQGR
ncbi:hypothetical protein D3C81_1779390 [compost metagenome]